MNSPPQMQMNLSPLSSNEPRLFYAERTVEHTLGFDSYRLVYSYYFHTDSCNYHLCEISGGSTFLMKYTEPHPGEEIILYLTNEQEYEGNDELILSILKQSKVEENKLKNLSVSIPRND